ncbi:MAG: hypothetical protein LBI78_03970 [Campylobacteraceae bacterium]|jgi:dihydroorotase|nr:hypothetical protein [Campylobacteraceae bacterium]
MRKTPFLIDCYDDDLDDNGVMNDGEVAKLCEIAKYYDMPILFQTLSVKRSIEPYKRGEKSNKILCRSIYTSLA